MSSTQYYDPHLVIDFEGDYYTDVNGYQVPQNIRHRFRSTTTSQLLADQYKVERDRAELERGNIKKKTIVYQPTQKNVAASDPDYEKLSNDLRSTVCRGKPVQRRSHTKTVHNEEIFKDFFKENTQSNLHRRKKDWLGRWMEADIIRDNLYKSMLQAKKKTTE
ncbi:unnamed protein product [Adineta steineri]|uniref:Uncharacterized protein n=1 Tax=Adineta steineri TaxID=433720 RepID=A0A815RJY5_9BILA|nr:unnamed protein product [Adineta steineri]CAF4074177.1 unnamed protein product [Adineta steineri]